MEKRQPTMQRAYATLETKAVEEDGRRIIRGTASTVSTDRMGDIVVPEGAKFALPLPLLWQHSPWSPVGNVTKADVSPKGITIEAELATVDDAGTLKDRLDEAWQSIKAGLVRGLSIGFRPITSEDIENSWGQKFTEWEWLELSAVTIPANADAGIAAIKSICRQQLPASENIQRVVKRNGGYALLKPEPRGNTLRNEDGSFRLR